MTGLRGEHLLCLRGKQLVFSTSGFILAIISCLIIGIGLLYVEQPASVYEYITSSAYAPSIWRPSLAPPDASPKLILLYSDWYGRDVVFPGFGFEHCIEKNCILSTDVEADFNRSDAVWFHSGWTLDALPPYPRPSPAQIWINSEVEALVLSWFADQPTPLEIDGIFNWSMTYDRDSDIWMPYGNSREFTMHDLRYPYVTWDQKIDRLVRSKSLDRLVVWHISSCPRPSRREAYVTDMMRYIPVHIEGKCALFENATKPSAEPSSYMFYLAFENSFCKDYITEKFWKTALQKGVIPVARGGLSRADYEAVAPPGSFIYADDFAGPRELAKYLLEVAHDEVKYAAYFQWYKTHTLTYDDPDWWGQSKELESSPFCSICEKLNQPHESKTTNFTSFTRGKCRLPRPWTA